MKAILALIIGFHCFSMVASAQEWRSEVGPDRISISLNTEIVVQVSEDLKDFKLLKESEVETALDVFGAMSTFERDEKYSEEIVFQFSEGDMLGSKITVLTTVHHLKRPITFKAKIKYRGSKKFVETSIVEKVQHAFSIEQWQDEIEQIILFDFQYLKE